MSRLTAAQLSSRTAPTDLREATALDLSNQRLGNVEELGACVALKKLNLSKNEVTNFEGLELAIPPAAFSFSSILTGVEDLRDLRQLNMSNNKLTTLPGTC